MQPMSWPPLVYQQKICQSSGKLCMLHNKGIYNLCKSHSVLSAEKSRNLWQAGHAAEMCRKQFHNTELWWGNNKEDMVTQHDDESKGGSKLAQDGGFISY